MLNQGAVVLNKLLYKIGWNLGLNSGSNTQQPLKIGELISDTEATPKKRHVWLLNKHRNW